MQKQVVNNPFVSRTDDYVDKGVDCSNPFKEVWTLKEVVKFTKENPGEDDFIIELKPVLIDKINVDEEIHAIAQGCDYKQYIQQYIMTGDDSFINRSEGQYLDITGYPTNTLDAQNAIIQGVNAYQSAPDDLKSQGFEGLANMSKEQFDAYIEAIVKSKLNSQGGNGNGE